MKFTTEKFSKSCACRTAGECTHNDFAETKALDALVDAFAGDLKILLHQKMREGSSGWDDPMWPLCAIQSALSGHVGKAVMRDGMGNAKPGDVLDIAAFAAFWWNRQ